MDIINLELIDYVNTCNIENIKILIEKGADINCINGLPLRNAIIKGDFSIVSFLVENGAYINAYDDAPIQLAAEGETMIL